LPSRVATFPCLSANKSVIPAPRIGKVVTSKKDTIAIDQEIRQNFRSGIPIDLANCNETRNVIAPNSEDKPRTWRNKIAIETALALLKSTPVSGK
jgi:hypothetical protein